MLPLLLVRLLICFSLGAVPALTSSQRDRLARTIDGPDERDDAFLALLENVQHWSGDLGDQPIRLQPDYRAMLAKPAAYRGDLCRVTGKIQQQTRLPPPNESVWEWFIRGEDRQPVLVYVAGLSADQNFRNGQPVEVDALFYKRIDALAMDGRQHSYPVFVGAFPRTIDRTVSSELLPRSDQSSQLWIVALPIGAMFIVFIGLLLYARRRPKVVRAGAREFFALGTIPGGDRLDEGSALPDDPAEALAELKRRALD